MPDPTDPLDPTPLPLPGIPGPPRAPMDPAERRGRRYAQTAFYSMVVVFILISTAQITWQVFAGTRAPPAPDCRAGLLSLVHAVDAARDASSAVGNRPEEALARFRAQLSPAWDGRDAILAACKKPGDSTQEVAFDTIERLRYAEENAVRRDARDLAPLRRRVQELLTGPLARP